MNRNELLYWLTLSDETLLETLWDQADRTRSEFVGNEVHMRGLIEFSNACVRSCLYCGIRFERPIVRYLMTKEEIVECAEKAQRFGYGTVVLQSGEDYRYSAAWLAEVVKTIKEKTALAVTLSIGERPLTEIEMLRNAGADRYLLRFETSNIDLYRTIHPDYKGTRSDRISLLRQIAAMGYEIGSGVMTGIPGQTLTDLAQDIEVFQELDFDMIGVGPYIPHPDTPLGKGVVPLAGNDQVQPTELMTYKMIALTRICCPQANIPSTTALATINKTNGRELGLCRGANVVMPNMTPVQYRAMYEIYPAKACIDETAEQCASCLRNRIASIDRVAGTGLGGRKKKR